MNANQYDAWMRNKDKPVRQESYAPIITDNRASQRIMPGMKEKEETRLDRILKPYRGRSYEGPTEPEVV